MIIIHLVVRFVSDCLSKHFPEKTFRDTQVHIKRNTNYTKPSVGNNNCIKTWQEIALPLKQSTF